MSIFIEFASVYVVGAIETLMQYYFFAKFIDMRAKKFHYLFFAGICSLTVALMPAGIVLKLLFQMILLAGMGIFLYKADCVITVLYTVITVEIMQICYGISNAVSGLLIPFISPGYLKLTGEFIMITSIFLALILSWSCYYLIYRYFTYSAEESNPSVHVILIPLFLIFLLSEFMNHTVYGNTIIRNRSINILNLNNLQVLVIQIFSISSLFCMLYVYKKLASGFKMSARVRSLEQERHYQNQYVLEAKSRYENTRAFRHDVKNHLSVVHGLLAKGEIAEAEKYLEDMETLTNELSFPCCTGNQILDILLGNKLGLAKAQGISILCSLELPHPCLISDMDFCIIFSNALDNAIHACEKVPENAEKYIHVSGRRQGALILFEIKNSYYGEQCYKMGTGLSNIKSVCEKYNGAVSISCADGNFCLSLLLIIPHHLESILHQND